LKKVLAISSRDEYFFSLFRNVSSDWQISIVRDCYLKSELNRISQFDFLLIDFLSESFYLPDLIARIREHDARIPFFVFSEENSCGFAEMAQRVGAAAYFIVPFNPDMIAYRIEKFLIAYQKRGAAGARYAGDAQEDCLMPELIGNSTPMTQLRSMIIKYAASDAAVLLTGESGSGKDLVARLIHSFSPFRNGPYIAFNVSCIPLTLAESTLFGSVKGAYTDSRDSKGLFECADKGSLFLDEITSLDRGFQPKLLRVLEDHTVSRVGSEESCRVNFRLICATNKPLKSAVKSGQFREDLMHRIDVLRLSIPPLREHVDDIPFLAASRLKARNRLLSVSALEKLQEYHWPGNVRQLFQCLSRAEVCAQTEIIYPEHIQF
jgi:DNA-binding NtrC family response regulator